MTDRGRALKVLGEVCDKKLFLKEALNNIYDKNTPEDPSYLWRVTKGVVERMIELDTRIDVVSSTRSGRMHPALRNALRLGAYEIIYMDSIPARATIHECVELVKKSPASRASGMANAVLRRISDTPAPDILTKDAHDAKSISAKYSLPIWLCDLWISRYGIDWTKGVAAAFLEEHPLTIRVNTLKTSRDRLLGLFEDSGIKTVKHPLSEHAILLLQKSSVTSLPGYSNGLFYVQDIGSISVCEMAGIKPQDKVLDLCAAPGGKSLFAAELASAKGSVYALDISEKRIERLKENIRKGDYKNIKTGVFDATRYNDEFSQKYDVVLADVPCSGLGVTGRKPEIKYRVNRDEINTLAGIQKKILNNACGYVKPGGKLVYSTCTLSFAENEGQIRDFISADNRWTVTKEKLFVPGKEQYNSDGFYICVMHQKAKI